MKENLSEENQAVGNHDENELFENEVIQGDHELYFLHHLLSEVEGE